MPDELNTPVRLEGDRLHLTPEAFAVLSRTVFDSLIFFCAPDEACRIGFRAIGLTEEQIASRQFRETKVVVHYV